MKLKFYQKMKRTKFFLNYKITVVNLKNRGTDYGRYPITDIRVRYRYSDWD